MRVLFLNSQFFKVATLCALSAGPTVVGAAAAQAPREFPVADADPTGHALCTASIQKAIDRCAEAGGGRVVLPRGRYLSGTIFMKSGVDLHLDPDATLLGSTQSSDYPDERPTTVRSFNDGRSQRQLIFGENLRDIAITGKGTIDGQGGGFPMAPRGATPNRPFVIRFVGCSKVRIEDVNLHSSAFWMQHYLACDDLTVRGIHVVNHANWNNDTIDIDGCHHVLIENLTTDSSDDGITLKGTSLRGCEDVSISHCLIRTHAVGIKFGTETIGGFRHIRISDCDIKRSEFRDSRFGGKPDGKGGIAVMSLDGAELEDVQISRVRIEGTISPVFVRLQNRGRAAEPGKRKPIGYVRDVTLCDITATDAGPDGSLVAGIPGHPIENLTLRHVHITTVGGVKNADVKHPADDQVKGSGAGPGMFGVEPASGILFHHVKGLVLDDVTVQTLKPDERPTLAFSEVQGLQVNGRALSADSTGVPAGIAFLSNYVTPAKPAGKQE